MNLLKVAFILLPLLVAAEKKIELQDIEEDNLKSEKAQEQEHADARSQGPNSPPGLLSLDFFKNGFLQYFDKSPTQPPQQSRYIHQYAVTEPPERHVPPVNSQQYISPTAQQAMVGYLSNVPMQIYLVPQYYNDQGDQGANLPHTAVGHPTTTVSRVASYPSQNELAQQHGNLIELPGYVTAATKYLPPYQTQLAYVSYGQPTVTPTQATIAPVLAYQMPVVQYPTALVSPPVLHKDYYHNPQYTESNTVEAVHENEIESPKHYSSQAEAPFTKAHSDYPRYYNPRAPYREDFRNGPNPLLLKGPPPTPPHLPHVPKAMRMFSRPITKHIYPSHGLLYPPSFTPKPNDVYSGGLKGRPTSLLDSYVPSNVQLEYMKRGYAKDPQSAYEALSSGRQYSQVPHGPVIPRQYEGGFLPNQMYHTGAGGITFGHYKRTPKVEKIPQ